ncbi:endolytic transglycosylase MltG [Pseudohongiella spirulinae]|uniref:endolytic transglycosylase MltG n=1 Tax=Pseudohongiella spirulinae TaxID=1249552 RepID=UPI001EEEDE75|nr:endolytic transglycosylase MltG [Pseudohongiella spirulinae]
MAPLKIYTGISLGLVAAVFAAGLWFLNYLDTPITMAQTEQQTAIINVAPGTGVNRLANQLSQELGLKQPRLFAGWVRFRGEDRSIKSGEYAVETGSTPRDLLALLLSGRNVQYPVTFIEGWTAKQALQNLWAVDTVQATLQGLDEKDILQALQSPWPALEGSLFPDTYFHTRGTTDLEILRRAQQRMLDIIDIEWPVRAHETPYGSPWEALIMASIIERESGHQAEKPDIAGVFVRRLALGMRLQSDPTVIYGMGETYEGVIRRSDLNTTTPWNTYRINGLPPTPIALPGLDSLQAALHPAPGSALYFVSRGDGSHQFSDTLEQHNQAVQRYLRNNTSE